jgi:hypothetical protein
MPVSSLPRGEGARAKRGGWGETTPPGSDFALLILATLP